MYKLSKTSLGQDVIILLKEDGSSLSFFPNEELSDYQEYLKWLAEGNRPLPAEEQR